MRQITKDNLKEALAHTARLQAKAADPRSSVWVSANAGTGKTHVLATRVMRLLLAGTPPEKILCLTYTKAAAAEMSTRVFAELARWVTLPNAALDAALESQLSRNASHEERALARTLFARAIDTPGGLKVQTIHAFSERLLQRFPLEAGVTPGFTILDDDTAGVLLKDAIDGVLSRATREPTGTLGTALTTAIAYAAEDHFDDILKVALGYRGWLDFICRMETSGKSGLDALDVLLRRHLGVRPSVTRASLEREIAMLMDDAELRRAEGVLAGGAKTDVAAAQCIREALSAVSDRARAAALSAFFCTAKGERRQSLMTKALKEAHPDLEARLVRVQERCLALLDECRGADATAATLALSRLSEAVMQAYAEAKGRRAALDFEDLIERTSRLLTARGNTEWVLFKLDGGLDHILVDESQDTSPDQWRIVGALAEELFAGSGAREEARTLFAVGDEKQSIYSFQGAAPRMFAAKGEEFAKRAAHAGLDWQRIPLDVSFRTVEPVLHAVDKVFEDPSKTPGVPAGAGGLRHIARRIGHAGLVEMWPTERFEAGLESDAWAPLDETPAVTPVARLAARIADTIKGWLDGGEMLSSEGRSVAPGDILILVRKRNPFAGPMVAALKARRIPVAGADRMALIEQIAVLDLMALGDFLTLPEDDLSLAEVLKSPLFGLDDAALAQIACGRKGSLWKALLEHAKDDVALAAVAETLKRWRRAADFTPPFEFFATLLDKEGGRAKLLHRLGPDAADAIDEFLNLALTYDDRAPPSLTGFLTWLRSGWREVKRDMEHGRNEVRVMTVHGAKGLEAPIVFLPDTCSAGSGGGRGGPLKVAGLGGASDAPDGFIWPVKGTSGLAAIRSARLEMEALEEEERNRLLYVAMTRARDRLYIAGFENKRGRRERGCWYEKIETALADVLKPAAEPPEGGVRRLSSAQTAPPEARRRALMRTEDAELLPAWGMAPAPREPQLAVPLAPSRLAPYEIDEEGEPKRGPPPKDAFAEPPVLLPGVPADQSRFLRGTITHALLQHLPSLDRSQWSRAAQGFVMERARGLSARVQSSIIEETLKVLEDEGFAPLFGPESRAEVPIVAEIPRRRGAGPALRLTGQIDRLAIAGGEVLVVDYKTNRPPPADVAGVAEVYLYQLAAYALAIGEIYPKFAVRAAILWTDGPRLMEIPADLLTAYQSKLWDLDPARLDG